MPFELKRFGMLNAMKVDCLGSLDGHHQEKLKFPDGMSEIHVCRAVDNCYILRTTIKTVDGIEDFLKKWTRHSRVVWRVNKTCPKRNSAGLKNIYWKEFRCQSSNIKISKTTKRMHKKHTNCPAYMGITMKKVTTRCRSRDSHMPKYPTIIKINNNHNHLIVHQDYLKNCPVSQETKNKFLRMYQKGHTPMSALNLHRIDLQGEYGDSIVFSEMDRSISPDAQWCYRLYSSFLANKEKVPDDEPEPLEEHVYINSTESSELEFNDQSCDLKIGSAQFDTNSNQIIEQIECCIENIVYDENPHIKTEYISDEVDSIEGIDTFFIEDRDSPNQLRSSLAELKSDQVNSHLTPFIELMTSKLTASPELFVPAFEKFNSRLKYFETDLDLAEALLKFGK